MAPVATGALPPVDRISAPSSKQSVEEVCFSAALICLEGHYSDSPPISGPLTHAKVTNMVTRTLEKTHTLKEVREALSRNVEIWVYLTKIFASAVPYLTTRCIGPLSSLNDPNARVSGPESTALILKNYASLKEDLQMLNKLMHIARNLLVTQEPEVPQDICAAVSFDQMVYQTIILCINMANKGIGPEKLDDTTKAKLKDIDDLYKKLLVTSLQQAHNWTAKNDRNKMSFWHDVLFDDEHTQDDSDCLGDGSGFRFEVAKVEVLNWLERNSNVCEKAKTLLIEYAQTHANKPPGIPAAITPLCGTWMPNVKTRADDPNDTKPATSVWQTEQTDKFQQDKTYGRVSHEVDAWWERARDQNFDAWTVSMPSIEFAQSRQEAYLGMIEHRYAHTYRSVDDDHLIDCDHDHDHDHDHHHHHHHHHHDHHHECDHDHHHHECEHDHDHDHHHDHDHDHHHHHHHHDHDSLPDGAEGDSRHVVQEYVDDMIDDDDIDDDESYGEGPMAGVLTELPNVLDPKQIEALHMIVKSCIMDTVGGGLTRYGENLQRTRCHMFLATDCGKSLFREMLVYIAVWDKDEQSLIFEITSQIVEAIHHNALLPYAWNSLRVTKDVISPSQAVLLRVISHMFRKKFVSALDQEIKDDDLDIKLVHYLFSWFRSRTVPECLGYLSLQAEVLAGVTDPADFFVDGWDLERARDGLAQFLEFINTAADIDAIRKKIIEWEAVYELITLLKALEESVPKKPLVELPPPRNAESSSNAQMVERPYAQNVDADQPPPPPPPPSQPGEPPHNFAWSGIKIQILGLLATLLQPPRGDRGPGNPQVQDQIMRQNGLVPLLNCCAYDDNNRYARERVQVCLKYIMDGSIAANNFLRDLVRKAPQQQGQMAPPQARPKPGQISAGSDPAAPTTTSLRVDGIGGEIKVQVRSPSAPGGVTTATAAATTMPVPPAATSGSSASAASGPGTTVAVNTNTRPALPLPPPLQGPIPPITNPPRNRSEELLSDIITLANEAARLALAHDGDETEDDFM